MPNDDKINHPSHYGGDTTYEAIKVIEAWKLNFNLGNSAKYLARMGKKGDKIEDLKKMIWYAQRELSTLLNEETHQSDALFLAGLAPKMRRKNARVEW